jgi:hypothetical protein
VKMFEYEVLRRIFVPKIENEELRDLNSSLRIISTMKSGMRWA